MKKTIRILVVAVLLFTLVAADPLIARAQINGTAANIDEVVSLIREAGLKRDNLVKIKYTGDDSEIDNLDFIPYGGDMQFFYGLMSLKDDPSTSDDADYLIASMRYSKAFQILYLREQKLLYFILEYFELPDETEYVNKHVGEILNKLGVASMSNYDKVKTIHDYICDLITYSEIDDEHEYSMYGAITNRKAVCNAYALCMYKLCVEAGVPCKYIGGFFRDGLDSYGHAWNIVALGDKWYYVDTTWDDTYKDDLIIYDYFLKGTEDFDESDPTYMHFMETPYYRAPFNDTFPIARTAFKEGDPDENKLITIGGTNPGNKDPEVTYEKKDIYSRLYPKNGKFTVKKNKKTDLRATLVDRRAAALVSDVRYTVTKGEKNIKKIKNHRILYDEKSGEWLTALELYGKKKGKVSIRMELFLVNGQTLKITFNGTVKNK